jgi:hypothetical protein
MRRTIAVVAPLIAAAALLPATALARLGEVGSSTAQGRPSCPTNPCLAVSRTTGIQMQAAGARNPYLVPRNGSIVAFTVSLGKPSAKQIAFFNKNLGGGPSARLTVLRPALKRANNFRFVVKAQSEVFQLNSYLGITAQFPLARSIPVAKNDLLALTVPTWAPVLAVGLGNNTIWRASRPKPCSDNEAFQQTAQQQVGAQAQYTCEYKTARMTYSATLVSTP